MKKALILLIALITLLILEFPAFGEDGYGDIYKYSGADKIKDLLDGSVRDFFDSENIDVTDTGWTDNLKTESVIRHIAGFLGSGAKTPVKCGLMIASVILIAAAVNVYRGSNATDTAMKFALTLSVTGILLYSMWGSITAAVNVLKSTGTFMMSFVPVYMSILSVSGAPATAAASGGMMLFAAEFVSAAAAFGQSAVIGAYLALCIGSAASPLQGGLGLAEAFKRVGVWFLSLCSTVFLGILGAKNAVNSAADSVSVKTARFILGTCVPVAGNALSGAVNTVSASLSVLKSSVGIYGVLALAVMLIPVICELLTWRLVLVVLGGVCEIFSMPGTSKLLKAFDGVFALLTGAVLLVGLTFIISLAVTVGAVRGS